MVDFTGILPVVGEAFFDWLKLFAAPLKNLDMLWIIVPIWGVWIFSEFFQEKRGTSFGNAITNGAVMLFVGIDWIRHIIRQAAAEEASLGINVATEIAISAIIVVVSLAIILMGIKGHGIVKLIGRARESTYLLLMFTPVIYGVVEFNFRILAVILAFFPFFYLLVELIDRVLPNPQTFDMEEDEKIGRSLGVGGEDALSGMQPDFSQGVFGQPQAGMRQAGFPQSQQRLGGRKF